MAASAAPAFATTTELEPAGPQTYQAENYFYNGQQWVQAHFMTVPGATAYAVRMDDGDWIPVTINNQSSTQAFGYAIDTSCAINECRHTRTMQLRAYTTEGWGPPGNMFDTHYADFGG